MNFEELKNKMKEMQDDIKKYGQESLKELFIKFFEDNPTIEAIKWDQYIPYFNDGDPCVFEIYEPNVKVIGNPEWEEVYYEDKYKHIKKWWVENTSGELEQIYETIFGSHSTIIVTRDGFDIEECDHE